MILSLGLLGFRGLLLRFDELLLRALFLLERHLLFLPRPLGLESFSFERRLDQEHVATKRTQQHTHDHANGDPSIPDLRTFDGGDGRNLLFVRQQSLLLFGARLGLLFELNAKLRFLGLTQTTLFLGARRTLLGEARFFFCAPPRLLGQPLPLLPFGRYTRLFDRL